jgi:hypothetical protein
VASRDRSSLLLTVQRILIALAPGVLVIAAAQAGGFLNAGLVDIIGDNVLTHVNLAIAMFVLDNAALVFAVITVGSLILAAVESRRDRLD